SWLMASLLRLQMADKRWVTVTGALPDGKKRSSRTFPLAPVQFALLRYLARERQENATDWLVKEEGQFVIRNAVEWAQACKLADVSNPAHEADRNLIDDNVAAIRVSHINEKIEPFVVKGVRLIESLR